MSRRRVLVGALLAVLAVLLLPLGAAQADSSGGTPPGQAWVRAGNFVSGGGPVSIQLTPQSDASTTMALAQRAAYGAVTEYRKIAPGSYTVSVRAEGATSASAPMLRRTLTVEAGRASTVALLGKKSAPRLATLSDDLTSPKPGTARVRVLSGSSDASDLSIRAVGGPQIASDVVLGQTTAYASVPDGSWTLALAGGDQKVDTTVQLASGAVYTAVVLDGDTTSDGKVRVRLVTDAQGVAQTPKGGAATGLGGTAGDTGNGSGSSGEVPGLVALGVLGAALLGAGSLGARRGSRRTAAAR